MRVNQFAKYSFLVIGFNSLKADDFPSDISYPVE